MEKKVVSHQEAQIRGKLSPDIKSVHKLEIKKSNSILQQTTLFLINTFEQNKSDILEDCCELKTTNWATPY